MNKKSQKWSVKFGKVKSVDPSQCVYKLVRPENKYNRSATYRNRKSIAIVGTDSECY